MHVLRVLASGTRPPRRFAETTYEVVEGDCLEAAIDLKLNRGLNPAVLNMASARRPGGGYKYAWPHYALFSHSGVALTAMLCACVRPRVCVLCA
jgi:hypothetical protein